MRIERHDTASAALLPQYVSLQSLVRIDITTEHRELPSEPALVKKRLESIGRGGAI